MSDNILKRTTPESTGISSLSIKNFIEDMEKQGIEMHSFMLLKKGKVVAEAWWKPYSKEFPHTLFSLSKSFTSTAVGFVVQDGLLSIEDDVCSYFPDNLPKIISDNLATMKVKHLLSMNTGHTKDTTDTMINGGASYATTFLSLPVNKVPGTHFLYNTGASYMLSAIVQKITGITVNDLLIKSLYKPLGIDTPHWDSCPEGINLGGFGLSAKTEDIAKLGQLYLNRGIWNGKQLLSADWVEAASKFQSDNSSMDDTDWSQGYGYQFWLCRHNAYRGDGAFGQYCIIMPKEDAVIAITSGISDMQAVLDSIWDILLPAMKVEYLEENVKENKSLIDRLNSLSYWMIDIGRESKITSHISNKIYKIDKNMYNIEEVSLSFNESNTLLTIKTSSFNSSIKLGNGKWHLGEGFSFIDLKSIARVAAGGTWKDENIFMAIIKYYETPFTFKLIYKFEGDNITIKTTTNVSFISDELITLTGHIN